MKIHHLEGHVQDMYLIEYPEKLLLLDAGCKPDVAMVCDFIKNTLGRAITDLKLVVVTHVHPDHAGGAHLLRKRTGCKIASSAKEKQWYAGFGLVQHAIDLYLATFVAHKMKKPTKNLWYNPFLKPDILLKDSDFLPEFEEWIVYETAGHTDRDLSLMHLPTKQIYTADLIIKLKKGFISPFPLHYPKVYLTSLHRIKNLKPSRLMLAHGGMVQMQNTDFDDMIKQAPKQEKNLIGVLMLQAKVKRHKK